MKKGERACGSIALEAFAGHRSALGAIDPSDRHGKTLNHMDVIKGVRGWRLGAIVHTLRINYGWPIVTKFHGPERIGHYHLARRCDPTQLEFPPSARQFAEELAALSQDAPGDSGARFAHG